MAQFINHRVSILPTQSYLDNIGNDGSGENCYQTHSLRNTVLNEKEEIRLLDVLYEDKRLINAFYSAYCRKKKPLWQKMVNRLSRISGRRNVYTIKKKIYS